MAENTGKKAYSPDMSKRWVLKKAIRSSATGIIGGIWQ
jgi:hypothetical protein